MATPVYAVLGQPANAAEHETLKRGKRVRPAKYDARKPRRVADGDTLVSREATALREASLADLSPPESMMEAVLLYVNTDKNKEARRDARVFIALSLISSERVLEPVPARLDLLAQLKTDLRRYVQKNEESDQIYAQLVHAFAKRLGITNEQIFATTRSQPPQPPMLHPLQSPEEPPHFELPAPELPLNCHLVLRSRV